MPKKVCSFCGRSEKDVNFLITGMNGFICDSCAQQAYQIVLEAGFGPEGTRKNSGAFDVSLNDVPKPTEILEKYSPIFFCSFLDCGIKNLNPSISFDDTLG